MRRAKKFGATLWKVFLGAVFCQFLPTSMLVVGWTYRAMQRQAINTWRGASPLPASEVAAIAQTDASFRAHATWPNWFTLQRGLRDVAAREAGQAARLRRMMSTAAASFGQNLKIGIAGIANTTVLTILPVLLWQFGWYAGWDNSFNKGYEQYSNGIALSFTGIVLFLAVMLYLPMAQARQAVTGEWRAFYDFRVVWRVATDNPVRTLLLAAAFSLVALPINVMLAAAQFFDRSPTHQAMTNAEFVQWLKGYYFWVSLAGFGGYVTLRVIAARWYASGVLSLLGSGRLSADALLGAEARVLSALALDRADVRAQRHPVIAATLVMSRPVWRAAVLGAALLVWFTFVAQIYVRQFFIYYPYRGFMNQPLVQLPWLRYVPAALENGVRAEQNR